MKSLNKTNIMFAVVVIVINIITVSLGVYFAGVFFSVMFALIVMAAGGFDKPEQPKTLCQLNIDKNCLILVREPDGSLTRLVAEIATGKIISTKSNCRAQDAQEEIIRLYDFYSLEGKLGDKPELDCLINKLNLLCEK